MQYPLRETATLAQYHGIAARARYAGGRTGRRVVTRITFASPRDANQWYNWPDYASLAALRQKAARWRVYILGGIP
jgi:uncharacterized protein (DUF1330 family)